GQADPPAQDVELLLGVDQPWGEPGVVQQAPEVVPRIGEMGCSRRGDAAGVDPAEDDVEIGRKDVRHGARDAARAWLPRYYAASNSGNSSLELSCWCFSKSLNSCSPRSPPLGRSGSDSLITATVESRSP